MTTPHRDHEPPSDDDWDSQANDFTTRDWLLLVVALVALLTPGFLLGVLVGWLL